MKYFKILLICLLTFGCSTTELIDNWKNPDIDSYSANKVLIIGMTSNREARLEFETQLQNEYTSRGIESVLSLEYLGSKFISQEKTEEELKALENRLLNDGFDTILFTKVIGVEDKIVFKEDYQNFDNTHKKFSEDYLKYQDAFYNPDYYEEYTVYHTETSMYCICPTKDRELIWKGYIDIIDPQTITETVNDYVRLVIVVLEEQQLLKLKLIEEPVNDEAI